MRAAVRRARERETVRGFTEWPTLDELNDSCLYLGSSTRLNHFLSSPSGHAKKPGDSCGDSVSFSEHYGVPSSCARAPPSRESASARRVPPRPCRARDVSVPSGRAPSSV